MTEDDRSEKARRRKQIRIGGDELSTLSREEIGETDDPPPPIKESIAALADQFRDELMEKGWPDPLLRHVWRDGCPTGEVVDFRLTYRIGAGQAAPVLTRPGWETLCRLFEAMDFEFGDDWYRAKLIGMAIDALDGEGETQARALVNFGFYYRDWTARRSFGFKAISRLRMERSTDPRRNPAIAAAKAERRKRSNGWKSAAAKIAAEMWRSKPLATASELAPRVQAKLRKHLEAGELPGIEKLPAVGTVRNELSRLRLKR